MSSSERRWPLWLQPWVTVALVALPISNWIKCPLLLLFWWWSFGPTRRSERWLFGLSCLLFTVMNLMALRQGIFAFTSPDLLGLPWYEFFMWGFYLLHARRLLGPACSAPATAVCWLLMGLFALCFTALSDPTWLLLASATLLAVTRWLDADPLAWRHAGYLLLLGALFEYVGVHSGQWHYPGAPWGGVPLWFVTMWGGIGFFAQRVAWSPLLRLDARQSAG